MKRLIPTMAMLVALLGCCSCRTAEVVSEPQVRAYSLPEKHKEMHRQMILEQHRVKLAMDNTHNYGE